MTFLNIIIVNESPKPTQIDLEDVFDAFEWQHIQPDQLSALKNNKILSEYESIKARIESEIHKKTPQGKISLFSKNSEFLYENMQ